METVAPPAAPSTGLKRLQLGGLAVLGIVVYQLILVGPWVAMLALNPWAGYFGVWPPVLAGLFLVWVMQPSHSVPGTPVSRDAAPALFAALDDAAARIGAPRIHEVRLTEEFNAAAVETAWRWQPWRKRRVLLLGIPLLALTEVRVVQGVIAHELGHFSHRHGRWGHWIYRTRAEWATYAAMPRADTSVLERGGAAFARWFAPLFSRLAFDHSRQCEYEADAYGAALVGQTDMARALLTVTVLAHRWEAMESEGLADLVAASETPPASWLAHVQSRLLVGVPSVEEWHVVRAEAPHLHDSHPATAQRIAALGVTAEAALSACQHVQSVAGEAWLPGWTQVVCGYDSHWYARHRRSWRQEHVRRRHLVAWLEALRTAGDTGPVRAELELEFGQAALAIDLVRRLVDGVPQPDAHAAFVLGLAELRAGNARGAERLEACIKLDPAWAQAARLALAAHPALLDTAYLHRNEKLLAQATARRGRVLGLVHERVLQATLAPACLPGPALEILRETMAGVPVVAAAWCAAVDDLQQDGRRYAGVVLFLRLSTERLKAQALTEDEIAAEARALLRGVVPAPWVMLVWTAYTTEPLAPELDTLLDEWARTRNPCCLVRPVEGEAVAAGVRASALG